MSNLTEALNIPAAEAAPRLLGCELERTLADGTVVHGRIVETEAYDQTDAASHSYRGRTSRTDIMFGPAGFLYVYFTYGMHYCCNVVVGADGEGAAVLIRALEPLDGLAEMRQRRRQASDNNLTNGPAKLCQALAIDKTMNAHDLSQAPLRLVLRDRLSQGNIVQTTRVGISRAKDMPWRFYIAGSQYVSRA